MAEHGAMRLSALLLLLAGIAQAMAATDPKLLLVEQKLKGFGDGDYTPAVERVLAEFEANTGIGLRPGALRKCGLKLSSEAGQGLATPKPLVRALGYGGLVPFAGLAALLWVLPPDLTLWVAMGLAALFSALVLPWVIGPLLRWL